MNPFGKLNVARDASDEESSENVVKEENVEQVKNKKKVRPLGKNVEDDEGYKITKGKKSLNFEEPLGNETGHKDSHKVPYMYREEIVHAKKGKRLYDKHSGTGRGKEVAKDGAGGHHTWGDNLKTISLETTKHLNDPTIEGENDDESKLLLYSI
jgi:hypothetical protein